jgi:beta-N-acetylhexosaminidase
MTFIGAFISGCSGPVLSTAERDFFARTKPWGLILF